ncbi:MAG: ATPase, T2SS/T4P/T4SS family [bacterium]
MGSQDTRKVGELLLEEGLVTKEQLKQVLLIQKTQREYKPLGELFIELGVISRAQLNWILNKYKKRIPLGELLVNLNLISENQLDKALELQKVQKKKLGDILITMGFLTETTLVNTLTIQLGVPKIVPDFRLIDKTLLGKMNEQFLLKYEVLPAFKQDNVLTVIMSNPLDEDTLHTLGNIFNCQIEPAVALSGEIKNAITQYFRKGRTKKGKQFDDSSKNLIIGNMDITKEGDNIVSILNYIIANGIMEGASDIHLEPKERCFRVRYRIDGILRHKTDLPITLAPSVVSRIKSLCRLDITEKRRHQDGRIQARIIGKEVDLRVSVYVSAYGENVVIRILHRESELIDLNALGISPANKYKLKRLLDQPSGIILVTGPTGSGKTTALYASLNYLNDGKRAIITVEDPIEYAIDGVVQGQLEHKLGLSYVEFLKSMMRQDPDVIMVGEIRDSTAAQAVIQAALTGHKVLSTFHTDDTTGALLRLMDMGIDTFLISSTVISIIAQRLVRVLCPHCKRPYEPSEALLECFNVDVESASRYTFYEPVGCSVCGDIGFIGRTAIHEVLLVNDAIRDAILSRKTSRQIRMIARTEAKLVSMREDGLYKSLKGITSLEEVLRVVFYNETDLLAPRSVEEIITLCEKNPNLKSSQGDLSQGFSKQMPTSFQVLQLSGSESALLPEGEIYRIRIETASMGMEIDRLHMVFEEYQKLMERIGQIVPSTLRESFSEFIMGAVKRLETTLGAEFIEICLRIEKGRIRIYLETLILEDSVIPYHKPGREESLRLIHYLLPSSGIDMSLKAGHTGTTRERKKRFWEKPSLLGFLTEKEGLPDERSKPPASPYEKGPGLYKKYTEVLEFNETTIHRQNVQCGS